MPRSSHASRSDLDQLTIDAIRVLAMDAVEAASSGHPGTPMALAPLGYRLFAGHLRHDPADPAWPNRDRFVLSAGHASMLLYGLLHLTGYDLPLDEVRRFRQLGGRTPGHPESFVTPGVETTTGPLGQGLGNAVGMALAERLLAARFNRPGFDVVDHRTVAIASDGDLMEGVSAESSSLAGHLALDKLVVLWDDNRITIDGATDLSFSENVVARYRAYGWRTLQIADVNDMDEIDDVLGQAWESDGRPTFVAVRTVIGFPAPNKAGTAAAHGAPLGADEVAAAKAALGWPSAEPFAVPDEVRAHADQRPRGAGLHEEWARLFEGYRAGHPELAAEFERVTRGVLPDDIPVAETRLAPGDREATRKSSEAALNRLAAAVPELVGGSADLAASNNTTIADGGSVSAKDFSGRNINYGVREHAMGAVMNGLALHGGVRPFGGTFLIFSDYLRPSLRLAALSGLPVTYVFTHDSIGLGEDGPTHQPVEHLAALRAMPNVDVLRPADATETDAAWLHALRRTEGPTLLVLSRQGLPLLDGTSHEGVARGAYPVVAAEEPDVVLVATGSEVHLAVEAVQLLADDHVRAGVVSMPCWEAFERQDQAYRDAVLPRGAPVLSVEAAASFGWTRWADAHVSLDRFGASAPQPVLYEHFGFTAPAIAAAARALLHEPTTDERAGR